MSEQPETPATAGADEPAALAPDDVTAVHRTGGEPAGDEPTLDAVAPGPVAPEPVAPAPAPAPAWTPPVPPAPLQESAAPSADAAVTADRPEVAVAAAFAGGLVLALILKRLAG